MSTFDASIYPLEIVIDTDVDYQLSGALGRRLREVSLGIGTVILIIRDNNIEYIVDLNLDQDNQKEPPLFGCKSLLRVNLKGCTKLTQLGRRVFGWCTS